MSYLFFFSFLFLKNYTYLFCISLSSHVEVRRHLMGVSSFFPPCMCSQEFNPGSTLSYGAISLDNSYFSLKCVFFLVIIFSHMIYMKAGSGLSFPFHISRDKQAYYRHSEYASMIHWLSEYTRYLLGIPEVQMPAMFIYLFTLSWLFIKLWAMDLLKPTVYE